MKEVCSEREKYSCIVSSGLYNSFLLQLKLQSHMRRHSRGAWPRLVDLNCGPRREYRFLKGAYREDYCEYDCIEAYLADVCGCATLVDRKSPYDALPACNYTLSFSCVHPTRLAVEKAESGKAPMPYVRARNTLKRTLCAQGLSERVL